MSSILDTFKTLAAFLAQQMKDCEFVIHDLNNLEHSIVFIGNGHISGRKIGDSATDLVLRVLKDKKYLSAEYTEIYRSMSSDGVVFNSSTFFIKENNELVGLLCINQDLTHYRNIYDSLGVILGATSKQENQEINERLVPSVQSLPDNVVDEVISQNFSSVKHLTKDDRLKIVKELDRKGVFLLKGSISEVAKTLKISDATMYRYLQLARSDE